MLLGQDTIVALGDTQSDRFWQHVGGVKPDFSGDYFDGDWLKQNQAVVGVASAGRGNTDILLIDGEHLVLRRYKRGGYASKLSEDQYLWTGLESARPFHELSILAHLIALQLPVPRPYAAEVVRHGASYSGSLITYRIPGITLAEAFVNDQMTPDLWHRVGKAIKLFHDEGVCHADLNAHNVMIRPELHPVSHRSVAILDFDRASLKDPEQSDWQYKVLFRLQRSLLKIADKHQSGLLEIAWQTVLDGSQGKARVV